jgi:hypothetical protein
MMLTRLGHAKRGNAPMARPGRVALAGLIAAVCACLPAPSAANPAGEYEVKAAFLYNFARFVEWPAQGHSQPNVLTLCILGGNPFGSDIDALAGKSVGQATLQVRRIGIEQASACQIVFISSSEGPRLESELAQMRGRPVLTIADSPGFSERGAVINFYLDQGKVRFEINIDAAQRSGLTISSQLLRLARITHDRTASGG